MTIATTPCLLVLPVLLVLLAGCGAPTTRPDAPACQLSKPALAGRLGEIDTLLGAHCREVKEEDDGYAIRFDDAAGVREAVERLAAQERACCPFLDWRFEPSRDGSFWVRVGGSAEARTFLEGLFPSLAGEEGERGNGTRVPHGGAES